MNEKIRKFWEQEGEIIGYRIGNRTNYVIEYYTNSYEGSLIAILYVSGEDVQWNYIFNKSIVPETKMVKIIDMKAFM